MLTDCQGIHPTGMTRYFLHLFAGSEIIEIGIQIEKNGRDFYDELVKTADDPRAKEAFKALSEEESKHI